MTTLARSDPWGTDDQRVARHYGRLLAVHGGGPAAHDWGSARTQRLRFEVLTQIAPLDGCSVLDVGCGLGDLVDFLGRRNLNVSYTGWDLSAEMVAGARRRFPQLAFEQRSISQEPVAPGQFDYVLASGLFAMRQQDPMTYVEMTLRRMLRLARMGVAVNTLSSAADAETPLREDQQDEFRADPGQMLQLALSLAPRVTLRHDYLPHDMTLHLYRDKP